MRPLKIMLAGISGGALMIVALVAGLYWSVSNPGGAKMLRLPESGISVGSPEGMAWLKTAFAEDYGHVSAAFVQQEKGSWCGVASGVIAINARQHRASRDADALTQDGFFSEEAEAARSWWSVTFGGMTLEQLADMLRAHKASVDVVFASETTEEAFRAALIAGSQNENDVMIVNYDREAIGESGGGHLSPIGAYAPVVDRALVMDTAAYKYPAHWVPVADLFAAMQREDRSSDKSRGWLVVR